MIDARFEMYFWCIWTILTLPIPILPESLLFSQYMILTIRSDPITAKRMMNSYCFWSDSEQWLSSDIITMITCSKLPCGEIWNPSLHYIDYTETKGWHSIFKSATYYRKMPWNITTQLCWPLLVTYSLILSLIHTHTLIQPQLLRKQFASIGSLTSINPFVIHIHWLREIVYRTLEILQTNSARDSPSISWFIPAAQKHRQLVR